MLPFAVILTVAYIGCLILEKRRNEKALASFQHVIHVNGIRGKTSTCRLIDANLRGAGYRVFTKTTGTTPTYIDTAGVEHIIDRHGCPSNIKEQLSIIQKAYREKAEILILECMAVDPNLQNVAQNSIVKSDIGVITNVRYDHIFAMGESLDEIAASLSNTAPRDGVLFTADSAYCPYFQKVCEGMGSRAVLCEQNEYTRSENEAIAFAIGDYLGVKPEEFRAHMEGYQEDFGANKRYEVNGVPFLNLFSVNDPQSTLWNLQQVGEDTRNMTLVYNHRMDRMDRLLLFIRHFFPLVPCKRIVVIGEGRGLARWFLNRHGITNVVCAKDWNSIFEDKETSLVVGIGNIKGKVYDILQGLEVDHHE